MPVLQFISKTSLGPAATYAVDHSLILPRAQLKLGVFSSKHSSLESATSCSCPKCVFGWPLRLSINKPSSKISCSPFMEDASLQHLKKLKKLNASSEKNLEHISHELNGTLQTDDYSDCSLPKMAEAICDKELERRRKIGLANRGRIPWNQGMKHSEGMSIESYCTLTSN